jgi:hypothetical protein
MVWLRKGIVGLLSLLLLAALVGGALSVSGNIAFTHPDKIESWLSQSHFYDSFITNAIDQAQKSADNSSGSQVSLHDPAVKAAAQKAFSPQLLQQDITTVLNSNYAWLQGKTSTPNFNIDLTGVKQNFANQVGQAVETRFASLSTCTTAQLAQLAGLSQSLRNIDPLSIPCRPPGVTPQAEAALVKQDVLSNTSFLGSNPAITASNANPSLENQSQPYYQKLSAAPKLYRISVALPWVYAVVALLSTIGIVFIALSKRRGLRRIGVVLLEAGIILVIIKVLADRALPHLESRVLANSGTLKSSLTGFLQRAESQLTKIDLWFGIAYLVLALVILIYLFTTRNRNRTPRPAPPPPARTLETKEPILPEPVDPSSPTKPPRFVQ